MEPNTVYTVLMIAGILTGAGIVWGATKNSIKVIQDSLVDQQAKLELIKDTLGVHTGQIAVIINRLDTIEQNVRDINTLFLAQNRIKP